MCSDWRLHGRRLELKLVGLKNPGPGVIGQTAILDWYETQQNWHR
jgi:hypothetical protein